MFQETLPSGYGYLPDPPKQAGDKPDWVFSTELVPRIAKFSTGDVDFRMFCTDSHQYSLPSCVGNATADSVEILSALQGHPKVELSRLFVWTLARNMMDTNKDGHGDIDVRTGTYIRLAFDVIAHFGICLEEYWPYDLSQWKVPPSLVAMRKATSRKIKGYYRITETGADRPAAILKALQSGHPVVFGTDIPENFSSYQGGTVDTPRSSAGAHAMACVGYDRQRGFVIKNSWGRGWGESGFGYFSPEYMSWERTRDIWVPTMGHNFIV